MSKVRIYGVSDDICKIEGSKYPENEIGCYDCAVHITFDDGTEIAMKRNDIVDHVGFWFISVEKRGTANAKLTLAFTDEAEKDSDVFEINAEIESIELTEI